MSADRTQHVLDAIDGALEDWTVSGDAMRWAPEPDDTVDLVTFERERLGRWSAAWGDALTRASELDRSASNGPIDATMPILLGWDGSRDVGTFIVALKRDIRLLTETSRIPTIVITDVY